MAMMVMPLLPFMITSKFSFLSDKAIGLMLNLAIKVCTIACMTGIMVPFFNAYIKDLQQAEGVGDSLVIMLQVFLASLLMYLLTKNISNIVSGLLSGQPSLGGSMMTAQLKNTVNKGAAAAGHVAAARDEAGGVLKPGFLANIAKEAAITSTPVGSAWHGRRTARDILGMNANPYQIHPQKPKKQVTYFVDKDSDKNNK